MNENKKKQDEREDEEEEENKNQALLFEPLFENDSEKTDRDKIFLEDSIPPSTRSSSLSAFTSFSPSIYIFLPGAAVPVQEATPLWRRLLSGGDSSQEGPLASRASRASLSASCSRRRIRRKLRNSGMENASH
ncbi:hypothetical protein EYF80_039108 [Liparis tanakae]|uniref:Uncharacterized protein n=1 Tax=Liparis tanakae TaxID=230148 RepID=A0A4Z2GAS9_9TELE|nr:hypothetical protein EYF80_039108 [Liparis tanakae]